MFRIKRLALSMAGAIALCLLTTGSASAMTRFDLGLTELTATSLSGLTLSSETGEVICDTTFHVSVPQKLISKLEGTTVARVTAILIANARSPSGPAECTGLTTTYSYDSFAGTLPNITTFTLEGVFRWLIRVRTFIGTAECLYFGAIRMGGANPIRRLAILPNAIETFTDLLRNGLCPRRVSLAGEFNLSPTLTVRLLER
jgi:hypothetical protein